MNIGRALSGQYLKLDQGGEGDLKIVLTHNIIVEHIAA